MNKFYGWKIEAVKEGKTVVVTVNGDAWRCIHQHRSEEAAIACTYSMLKGASVGSEQLHRECTLDQLRSGLIAQGLKTQWVGQDPWVKREQTYGSIGLDVLLKAVNGACNE